MVRCVGGGAEEIKQVRAILDDLVDRAAQLGDVGGFDAGAAGVVLDQVAGGQAALIFGIVRRAISIVVETVAAGGRLRGVGLIVVGRTRASGIEQIDRAVAVIVAAVVATRALAGRALAIVAGLIALGIIGVVDAPVLIIIEIVVALGRRQPAHRDVKHVGAALSLALDHHDIGARHQRRANRRVGHRWHLVVAARDQL